MSARDRREQRRSLARQRATQRGSGYSTTLFKMPSGLGFFKVEKGRKRISILTYKLGHGNPHATAMGLKPGDDYYERTFYIYRKIGADENTYIAPGKTANQRDFIQEWREKEARNPDADKDMLKALQPKERQVFLVFDHDDPDKGVQLFEFSFHKFGKLLDERIQNSDESKGWDFFYEMDDNGFMLELTIVDTGTYGMEVKAIDFEKRSKPLPDSVLNHNICLDDMLIIPEYEELKAHFLCLSTEPRTSESSEPRVEHREERREERRDPPRDEPRQEQRRDDPQPQPKQEQKAEITAKQIGVNRDDKVEYNGKVMTIVRVSEDGLSLTLMDENDDIHKPIKPADVKVLNAAPPKQEQRRDDPQPKHESAPPFDVDPAPNDASAGDDAWDKDWDA